MAAPQSPIPVIDVSPLFDGTILSPFGPSPAAREVCNTIHNACLTYGFFQATNTNVPSVLISQLAAALERFFALPEDQKLALHVQKGGPAWRGYMPWGGEGTKGKPDLKEGFYGGPEHDESHPLFGMPLHGKNQFPDAAVPEMRPAVLEYIDKITELGKTLCDAMSVGLELEPAFIRDNYLSPEPIQLFRAFRYVNKPEAMKLTEGEPQYGIGEHSDFGLLTILSQHGPGLEMQSPSGEWLPVPVIENGFICNVGDILDRFTGGRYRSVLHRVQPPAPGTSRLSIPFFFDPAWTTKVRPFPLVNLPPLSETQQQDALQRWQKNSTFAAEPLAPDCEYLWAQYLAKKVQKVFPDLPLEDPTFIGNSRESMRHAIVVHTNSEELEDEHESTAAVPA